MISDQHAGIMATSKFGMGIHSNKRSLADGAHKEAMDLWQFSQKQMHPSSTIKDTIAHQVSLGQRKNIESIPYGSFKNGVMPGSYMTMSIDPNAEPTTQPIAGRMIPLELAGLQHSKHLMPSDFVHDTTPRTYSSGRDDIMRAGKALRYKTSYARPTGSSVPFQRNGRSSSTLQTIVAAQSSYAMNSGLNTSAGGAAYTGLAGDGSNSIVSQTNLESIMRLVVKISNYIKGSGVAVTTDDPDIIPLIQAGVDTSVMRKVLESLSPSNNAGVRLLLRVLDTTMPYAQSLAAMLEAVVGFADGYNQFTAPGPGGR
jgi:hypothetical protein